MSKGENRTHEEGQMRREKIKDNGGKSKAQKLREKIKRL